MIGCHVALPAVPIPLFDNISQFLRDSFSISQQPPIWEPPSHSSMVHTNLSIVQRIKDLLPDRRSIACVSASAGVLLIIGW